MIDETSAGIVLFRRENDKILFLLLHYPSGHWDFVKGKMEKGETYRETAIRETKEETGISDVNFVDNFEEWIQYNFQFEGELVNKKVVFFLAETKTKEIEISHEHLDFTWMDYVTAMEKTTFDNAKTVLSKSYALLSKTL
ncbi:MAG: NUDIX domain-containing protein [Nitrosopumilaceae archaeon]|jgi:8-oxo-dGTP pyrophosphatase MutT (NUDIX family)|uniref:NUDIX domain-containing protein n=2 Tax=Candidatus Nitrosomaritimum aestuariumsis TaxID=3342354 RepID=A0AC60VY22_9ARCH|nr:NUDIX domain-containing protein [Nitrosopumilaceae archaeon]MBA4459872.1 NUDIX domain-containing protein [Nitrosopumilaceae archaeon]MBA4461428.1 NUDIX domain-containing protein [Nitrosopumilaceae archaeon]MBA4463330.1 NUDIX domain-containing protein [Nitrosopumilaceae archaeon]NCF21494.1 NUDIX domain-containing protein [Nitrosopumilaceae archaeon]